VKRPQLLAGLCVLCFFIAGVTALALFVFLWEEAKVGIIIVAVFLIAAFILKKMVNDQEREIKEKQQREAEEYEGEYQTTLELYSEEEKKARRLQRKEVEWRKLKWFEFMGTGMRPKEADREARKLIYPQKGN